MGTELHELPAARYQFSAAVIAPVLVAERTVRKRPAVQQTL
ncbi:hypothetical protein [Nocardia carnea]|nr:hypothetical protein [Nocardia carnea]